jgi:tetratricopeptide (TPR) repeat protein
MSGAINSVPLGSTATTSGLGTTASASGRLQSPQQQSTQYAELQRRLQQSRETTDDKTDAGPVAGMSSRQLQPTKITTDVVTRQPGAQPTDPNGVTTPSGSPLAANAQPPRTGALPGQPVIPGAAPNASGGVPDLFGGGTAATPQALPGGIAVDAKQPLQVHSLAEGVQAPALATLLKEAETSLKAGRYNTALEQYDDAERVAPNNPLILLGRANAELGQSYYARAESHLRQAFTQDQALLMGQYDLREMLGNERLDFLARDLRGIADREQRESRPVLLLAYLAYNTGDARRAAAYLDLAEKRAAGADPIYPLLRKHWSLPASALPTEMSK